MNAIEYANRILQEFRSGKTAKNVRREDGAGVVVLIECTDGTVEQVHGYWAVEILDRMRSDK